MIELLLAFYIVEAFSVYLVSHDYTNSETKSIFMSITWIIWLLIAFFLRVATFILDTILIGKFGKNENTKS